jgi:hypothetical protein
MQALIHIANVLFLLSYLVKDILWLRVLTVVASIPLVIFYFLQPAPLWAAIGWNAIFTLINVYQVYVLVLERRPVALLANEQRLYQLAFRTLTPREFVKLLRLAKWEDAPAAQRIVARGEDLDRVMVIFSGKTAVEVEGRIVVHLKEGQFIGEMSFITGERPTADVVAVEETRIVSWPKRELRAFLEHNPPLRAAMQLVIGTDLVAKLRAA